MSAVQASDLADRISGDKQYLIGVFDQVFRNDQLIGGIIPHRGYQAGTSVKVQVVTGANTSVESFTENMSAPARGKQTVVTADFNFRHWRVMVGETGHAMRARGPMDQGIIQGQQDPEFEIKMAIKDLWDLVTTDSLSANTYGLQGIISDSTYAYGDLSRAQYTVLVSYLLNASSADISTSLLNTAAFRSREAPYGAKSVQIWLASPLQCGKVAELMSGKLAAQQVNTDLILDSDRPINLGGYLMVPMPDLTTSVILGLTSIDRSWGYTSNQDGEFHFRRYGATDDSSTDQIATAGTVWCNNPKEQLKIYGLSTT